MEIDTKANGRMRKNMDMESIRTLMGESGKECGGKEKKYKLINLVIH